MTKAAAPGKPRAASSCSATGELLLQSGESLAGRVAYLELPPLQLPELAEDQQNRLWLRGGFPNSLLASSDSKSRGIAAPGTSLGAKPGKPVDKQQR